MVAILVTGNLGYVGTVLGQHLRSVRPSWNLNGLDAGYFLDCLSSKGFAPWSSQVIGDIRNLDAADLNGLDAIVHLAALSNDPIGSAFAEATRAINMDGSMHVASLARKARVRRFVFASTCSVYGAASQGKRREQDAILPLTVYATAKAEAEAHLREFASSDFQVTSLRFATACGASECLRLDLVLNDFVAAAVQSKAIEVFSDGTPWRPLIHTRDMARAIEWSLIREGEEFVCINVGSGAWTWQVGQLAKEVASILGDVEVTIRGAATDSRTYRAEFSRFEQLAGNYQPVADFEKSVLELRDQIRSADLGSGSFRQSKYIRLNELRRLRELGRCDASLRLSDQAMVR